jgi:DNA-binding IclR family transcriptional regulator
VLGTVGKASRVLDLFTRESPEWGVTDAALELQVPRSSAHDLLDTLAQTGLLRRVEGNCYRLGLKLLTLSDAALDSLAVRCQARPVMECLARKLKATVHLATLDGTDVVYLDKVTAEGGPRIALSGVGRRLPLHCTAVGKVLLAHQSPGTICQTLDRLAMEPVTDRTISSVDTLRFELASSRRSRRLLSRRADHRGRPGHRRDQPQRTHGDRAPARRALRRDRPRRRRQNLPPPRRSADRAAAEGPCRRLTALARSPAAAPS